MRNIRVAVDAMGGDLAPDVVVAGAVRAGAAGGVRLLLVGQPPAIEAALARQPERPASGFEIVEAPDVIGMTEAPVAALRRKPRASVRVAAELVAAGRADALFSAGHTGATLIAAHSSLGLLPGVDRPALAVTVPTRTGVAVLLDAGANPACRPEHLVQFAFMGSAYARAVLGLADPRVGLLSTGEEVGKGTDLVRETHARLHGAALTFVGNVEARELFTGRADVIVSDGFTGNIALKVGEGLIDLLDDLVAATTPPGSAARETFARLRDKVDYAEHGAAPLLGLTGLAMVGHGRSSERAVESGIALTVRLARQGVIAGLERALERAGRGDVAG